MHYVSFPQLGNMRLSRLAFGCAPVMGRVDRRSALDAMAIAFEHGVTHFDVARSYGFGEAERVLGEFIADRRDRVTVATKFGIRPTAKPGLLRIVKPAVRAALAAVPSLRAAVRRASSRALAAGHYSVQEARASIEQSLRELGTDYVDLLFVHDPAPDDCPGEALADELDRWVREGKVRAWGIATRREWTAPVFAASAGRARIVQCAQNLFEREAADIAALAGLPTIHHSPFAGDDALARLQRLAQRGIIPAEVAGDATRAGRFLLECALHLADERPVLCSMFRPAHIAANIEAVDRPMFAREQIAACIARLDSTAAGEDSSERRAGLPR